MRTKNKALTYFLDFVSFKKNWTYTPQRRAEFLLSNAIDAKDYARAAEDVRKMGLDTAKIPHRKPAGVK
jgi:hypothetical protein